MPSIRSGILSPPASRAVMASAHPAPPAPATTPPNPARAGAAGYPHLPETVIRALLPLPGHLPIGRNQARRRARSSMRHLPRGRPKRRLRGDLPESSASARRSWQPGAASPAGSSAGPSPADSGAGASRTTRVPAGRPCPERHPSPLPRMAASRPRPPCFQGELPPDGQRLHEEFLLPMAEPGPSPRFRSSMPELPRCSCTSARINASSPFGKSSGSGAAPARNQPVNLSRIRTGSSNRADLMPPGIEIQIMGHRRYGHPA